MHLVTDADSLDITPFASSQGEYLTSGKFQIVPPHIGFLFCPPGLKRENGGFALGIEGGSNATTGSNLY
jgi:hypothetical protein